MVLNQLIWSNNSKIVNAHADASKELEIVNQRISVLEQEREGFDLPGLDTLFLTMPIAWRGLLAQYAGRIHREFTVKEQVTIFDYVDASIPMLQRMYNKREKGYKAMGYQIGLLNMQTCIDNPEK